MRYPVRSTKSNGSRYAVVLLIGDGITRPHLCLYELLRLFNASLLIYAIRSARQVRACGANLRPLCAEAHGCAIPSVPQKVTAAFLLPLLFVERETGFGPATFTLAR